MVGLCVLPIHLSKDGCGRPVDTLYFMPLAAGTWGGMQVKEAAAQQGRELAGQLLHAEQAVVAYGMQSGWAGARGLGWRWRDRLVMQRLLLPTSHVGLLEKDGTAFHCLVLPYCYSTTAALSS